MRRLIFIFVLGMFISCQGCGGGATDAPPLGSVSGTVTIDGEPTGSVAVTFTPEGGGRPSSGTTDANGYYTLGYSASDAGALVGTHTVTIEGIVLDYDESTPGYTPEMAAAKSNPVPEAYRTVTRKVEVSSGSNTIDLAYPAQ